MTTPRDQYQHYIPRFILRTFQTDPTRNPTRSRRKKKRTGTKALVDTETVHSYDLGTGEYDPNCRIAVTYGSKGLYRDDMNVSNANHIEEKFARLENDVSRVIKSIQKDANRGMMTTTILRKDAYTLRKFLFLQHIRTDKIRKTYFDEEHPENARIRDWIRKQKEITDRSLWLDCLHYSLDTPTRQMLQVCNSHERSLWKDFSILTMKNFIEEGDMSKKPDLKQWHAITYGRFHNDHFLSICYASKDGEFVLGHNTFGLWEGTLFGINGAHLLYILSPKIAIVLRRNESKGIPELVDSILNDIPFSPPAAIYACSTNVSRNLQSRIQHIESTNSDNDRFIFTIHELSDIQTYRINEIVLENIQANDTLVFASERVMLNTLKLYDSPQGSFDKPRRAALRILREKLSERSHAQGGNNQGVAPLTPSTAACPVTITIHTPSVPSLVSNAISTSIVPEGCISESSLAGTQGPALPKVGKEIEVIKIIDQQPEALHNKENISSSFCPTQVAVRKHEIPTMSNDDSERFQSRSSFQEYSRGPTTFTPDNLSEHLVREPDELDSPPPEIKFRNISDEEDNLPETAADVEFKRVLALVQADNFELHFVKARKLYKAAVADAHMNNPLALKIRASIANAVSQSINIERQSYSLYPICPEDQYSNFHRYSNSWIQLSDKVENILTGDEYEAFFIVIAAKMERHCIVGPSANPSVGSATICGLLEWEGGS